MVSHFVIRNSGTRKFAQWVKKGTGEDMAVWLMILCTKIKQGLEQKYRGAIRDYCESIISQVIVRDESCKLDLQEYNNYRSR